MTLAADLFVRFPSLGDATAHVDRILEIIEHIRLFEDFDRSEIMLLTRHMRCFRAEQGAEVICEGEPGDFMMLVLEGSCEILRRDSQGGLRRMAVDGPGKTLGEMSLIDGEPRFASCVTLAPTLFALLDRDALSQLVATEPKTGIKMLMELLVLLNQRLRALSGELMACMESRRTAGKS
jgi:CRP-like cAMP-binding protein